MLGGLDHSFRYLFWGLISNKALDAYYAMPRAFLQDELFRLHRFALKKAHHARVKGEAEFAQSQGEEND